jgi:hypothetical protein
MEVLALGPLYAVGLPWQRQGRDWLLTVVCKATFDLAPGELRLSAGQEPINESDNHWDDDTRRSVYAPNDMAPFKKGVDVTLVGNAYAPHRQPCRSVLARLVVGTIDKAVEVHADRAWTGDAQITDGPPFTQMPLRYERAQGGPGTPNPVGIVIQPGPLPNLHPARRAGTLQDDGSPVGFAPIAATWPQRESRLRRHRGSFPHVDWFNRPLPDDIEVEYFNVAPADQRLAEIASDQEFVLENMHPEHARLVGRLPGIKAQAFVERHQVAPQELAFVADALWFDTDRAICTLTWRTQLPLVARDEPGRVIVIMGPARRKLEWAEVHRLVHTHTGSKSASSKSPTAAPTNAQTPRSPAASPSQIPTRAPTAPRVQAAPKVTGPNVFEEDSVETAVLSFDELAQVENMNVPHWIAGRVGQTLAPGTASTAPTSGVIPSPAASAPAAAPPPLVARPAPAPAPPKTTAATPPAPVEIPRQTQTIADIPAPVIPREVSPWAAAAAAGHTAAPTHTAVATPITTLPVPADEPRAAMPVRAPRRASVDVVDLLWFDAGSVPRIRAAFPAIVDELEFEPIDPKHDLPMDDPNASRDRHDVFGILTKAQSTDGRGLARCMLDSVSETGRFTPPAVAMSGELRFPFDEVELLNAMIAAVSPLSTPENKKLEESLGAAREVQKTPMLQSPSSIESVLNDLRDALRQTKRASTSAQLDTHIERVLLEQRKYQKRSVFGDEQIRSLFVPSGETAAIPAYLPASLTTKLPLVLRMKVRFLAEAHAQQDQYESHAHALRVIALGRVVAIEGWR